MLSSQSWRQESQSSNSHGARLSEFDLVIFNRRARTMKMVQHYMKGALRVATCTALRESGRDVDVDDQQIQCKSWKLLLLPPRMLLEKPVPGGRVPTKIVEKRVRISAAGQFQELVCDSNEKSEAASPVSSKRQRRSPSHALDRRVSRAMKYRAANNYFRPK